MMLQGKSRFAPHVHEFAGAPTADLSMLAYRSIAVAPPTDVALQQLLNDARSRNRAQGLTGVLIYDRGAYFQWLEGPRESLQRLWTSISRDPRHHHVTVLRKEPINQRVFADWSLRVVNGAHVSIDATVAAMESSNAQLKFVIGKPKFGAEMSLDVAFETIVIPRLLKVHGRDVQSVPLASAAIWHADEDSGMRLASALLSPHAAQSDDYVDALLEQGAGFNALYREVFEPAQLHLGKLWDQDLCDDFHLAMGLGRLQLEIMRVNAAVPGEHSHKPNHSVLLSSQPNEPHRIGVVMSSEVFHRDGWDVTCHLPDSDEPLGDLLRTQWFDILKLSESGSLRRDSRLASLRGTINSARAASMNRSLIVMVDGRIFAERPQTYRSVHADAMCLSALDAAPIAERLLQLTRLPTPSTLS